MNKLVRKLVLVSMSMLLVFSSSTVCLANDNAVRDIVVEQGNYTFYLKEMDKGEEGLIRIYTNDNARSIKGVDETKSLLYALGYNERYVEGLTINEVQEYASASEIIVSVAYMKTDEKGNTTYIDAETALEEVKVAREREQTKINNLINGIVTVETEIDYEENAYMMVIHGASIKGAVCDMAVNAEWLTMPAIRSYDSVGACGQYLDCLPGTGTCEVSYERKEIVPGGTYKDTISRPISNIQLANDNGWAGMAAVFKLPEDIVSPEQTILYSGFYVEFGYKGEITLPDQRVNFNTIGSYTHATIRLTASPSISISTGGVDAGIGISIAIFKDKMSVWLALNYVPES